MYICLCNGYRDEEIRNAAEAGIHCAREAYERLGQGPQCGCCLPLAQELIDGVHDADETPLGSVLQPAG